VNIVTLEKGTAADVLAEAEADIIVLRGDAMRDYVGAISAALGHDVDLKGAPCIHGILRPQPNDPFHVSGAREWYLGEPMPKTGAELREELRQARERIWFLEHRLTLIREKASTVYTLATEVKQP
jgi:hypothetical protein